MRPATFDRSTADFAVLIGFRYHLKQSWQAVSVLFQELDGVKVMSPLGKLAMSPS